MFHIKMLVKTGSVLVALWLCVMPPTHVRAQAMVSFEPPLDHLSDTDRERITATASATGAKRVMGVVFRERTYLAVYLVPDLPPMPALMAVLDERSKMSEAQRVTRAITELALPALRRFNATTTSDPNVVGIKIVVYEPPDSLELYAPLALVKRLVDLDITSQTFIDGCIVIRNENRVDVSLK